MQEKTITFHKCNNQHRFNYPLEDHDSQPQRKKRDPASLCPCNSYSIQRGQRHPAHRNANQQKEEKRLHDHRGHEYDRDQHSIIRLEIPTRMSAMTRR